MCKFSISNGMRLTFVGKYVILLLVNTPLLVHFGELSMALDVGTVGCDYNENDLWQGSMHYKLIIRPVKIHT